jgi:hypothetical protein
MRGSGHGPRLRAIRTLVLLALVLLCSASCFEPPVREELRLDFLANGAVVVTSLVEVAGPEETDNPALARRLAELRQALAEGWDPWTPRFAALSPAAERFFWEKRLGEIHRASRSAVLVEPEALPRFFADTALQVVYTVDPDRRLAELSIAPGPSQRASRRQRRELGESVGPWTEAIAAYLGAAAAFYAHAEEHPERAAALFGSLFAELLPDEERQALAPATPDEEALLDRLGEAMEKVWEVLRVPAGRDHSLDELSRLVYDPFPAPLAVRLPAPAVEVEGFAVGPDGALAVPGLGLWAALAGLEGRWLDPDPLLLYVERRGGESGEPFSLAGFLARPRSAVPESLAPDAAEVRQAIEAGLEPEPLYRAVWPIDPEAEPELPWE